MAQPATTIRDMKHDDLAMVSDIERRSYEFPWSHGVFRDCLLAGYQCVVLIREGRVAGYSILSIAAGEAHILNLCIDPEFRALGYGEKLLDELLYRARSASVREISACTRKRAFTRLRHDLPTIRHGKDGKTPRYWPRNSSLTSKLFRVGFDSVRLRRL